MNESTNLNDLAALARTTKSARLSRAATAAASELEQLRAMCSNYRHHEQGLFEELASLRARVKELEANADWHIDMVIGDAWLCRIEGKFEDIDLLLGNAVGKQIQAYEIDTSHHENTHE